MKGLFQCPPRASPWVVMFANLSPCKGKSFKEPDDYKAFALSWHKKSRGILEGESPRQLKFQRPV